MVLKSSYLSQKIKWERALSKPTFSIVQPILIWVYHWKMGIVMGKNPNLFISQARIRLGTCITILGFSKSYAQQKNNIFKL